MLLIKAFIVPMKLLRTRLLGCEEAVNSVDETLFATSYSCLTHGYPHALCRQYSH